MKDTNKVVLGVTITFTVISVVAVSLGGSSVVSVLSSLIAIASSLAYKYRCERDIGLDLLKFTQKTLIASNNRITILEDIIMAKADEDVRKAVNVETLTDIQIAKVPRRYKSKPKTEVV